MDNSTLADAIAADLTDNSTMSDTTSTVVHAVSFYGYTPNLILPIVVAILFLIASLGHTYFMVKRKSWYMVRNTRCSKNRSLKGKKNQAHVDFFSFSSGHSS